MYLEEIYLENTGPISKCHVEKMPFDDKGNPRPVVVVGGNGSGKSIFLSYIVDALMEFAKRTFEDIVPSNGLSGPYYRVVHPMAIKSGERYSLGLLRFKTSKGDFHYGEKCRQLDLVALCPSRKTKFDSVCKWNPCASYRWC